MWSYWEWKNFKQYDLIVIGAGIVGLSTAIQYKEKFPERKVLVLERGLLPTGASTKNAGFACFGSLTEILDDLEVLTEQEVLQLVRRRYSGLQAIRDRFGDAVLGFKDSGGYELFTTNELPLLNQMEVVNQLLLPIFNEPVFSLVPLHQALGFGPSVKAIVKNRFEGELDTGYFIQTLWHQAQLLGVFIMTGADVQGLDRETGQVSVRQFDGAERVFDGGQIAVCTNAFTKKLIPSLTLKPGRGLVLVTKPLLNPINWEGSFHYDKGYVYFRSIDNRLLIGGGRNQDFETEETLGFEVNSRIRDYLLNILHETILPDEAAQIEFEWTGIMAFGPSKMPVIQQISDRLHCAVRLGGMGVAVGWQTASELVDLF
ncbi:NAD(P)/FAD-dependent oxidoreductase [Mongoliitalea daihaiensis]|uniref:NAD(P)/FAD-dependent oxidoreductase n=1 Tax=Mongoliitalea daihaiensis TaxID=2782006 RepID=UPI001F3CC605|nr:FAD-dependent oxidoreductase [Mongoliitalea daihaiensis]UJP63303.1 FAD-binding oxidoreductase [Mongoliitalea daihaiensis]